MTNCEEEFLKKALKIHGDKYDYSKMVYIDCKHPISIRCKKHDFVFCITPDKHLNAKRGCPICSGKIQTQESFLAKCRKVHGDKYDYSKVLFTGANSKIIIICPKHGEFVQKASKHLNDKQGCPHCRKRPEVFKKEIESVNKEIEILNEYVDVKTKVRIKCLKCSCESERYPSDLLHGYGCYFCNSSVLEKFTEKWLLKNNISYEREKTFPDCKDKQVLPFDFFLPEKKILIECQGKQHYFWQKGLQPTYHHFLVQKHHDWLKRKFCLDNKIKLIYINYWDFSSWKNNKIGEILTENIKEKNE